MELLYLVVRIDKKHVAGKISETNTAGKRKMASPRLELLGYGGNDSQELKMYRRASVVDVDIQRRKEGRKEGRKDGRKEGKKERRMDG